MGIYLLVIASADLYFGQDFPMRSEAWRSVLPAELLEQYQLSPVKLQCSL